MAFPPEFKFANEADFIARLLIPLLQRLGFSLVVNYHGNREFGKDLVFAEIDRFGHVRYHGLQAKYEGSISLNEVQSLISDCHQAFANPFTHPQTGTVERISGFYAANGGSLGAEAVAHYFNSLRPHFGGNVHLLQGKDLVTLDRWASVNRVNAIEEQITGLLLEIRYNIAMLSHIKTALAAKLHRPLERLRLEAVLGYLRGPILSTAVNTDEVETYWHLSSCCNNVLNFTGMIGVSTENRDDLDLK